MHIIRMLIFHHIKKKVLDCSKNLKSIDRLIIWITREPSPPSNKYKNCMFVCLCLCVCVCVLRFFNLYNDTQIHKYIKHFELFYFSKYLLILNIGIN